MLIWVHSISQFIFPTPYSQVFPIMYITPSCPDWEKSFPLDSNAFMEKKQKTKTNRQKFWNKQLPDPAPMNILSFYLPNHMQRLALSTMVNFFKRLLPCSFPRAWLESLESTSKKKKKYPNFNFQEAVGYLRSFSFQKIPKLTLYQVLCRTFTSWKIRGFY